MLNNETEKILTSIDGIEKMPAPGFFYTRLAAKMQRESGEEKSPVLFRPAFLTVCLGIICIINIVVLATRQTGPRSIMNEKGATSIESFANEYNMINNGDILQ